MAIRPISAPNFRHTAGKQGKWTIIELSQFRCDRRFILDVSHTVSLVQRELFLLRIVAMTTMTNNFAKRRTPSEC